ncbi:MAG: PEP-CTERM sorting domain-containing protein [Phycisphaerae bacterium]|nr:PEP-CTERM sorting domain-containing protein [Phycisphaerae bacterium]
MKKVSLILLGCLLWAGASYGGMIVQHVGATDPTTEGWTLNGNAGQASALTPDPGYGVNAWATDDTMASTCRYDYVPSSTEASDALTLGYTFSATLRLPDADMPLNDAAVMYIKLSDGTNGQRYVIRFETDSNAIPTLHIYDSRHSWGTSYALSSGGYHTYSLVHDGSTGKADLLVDGTVVMDDISPDLDDPESKVIFGNDSGGSTGFQSNWAAAEFSIVPEPATLSLLLSGGGLALLRRRSR